MSDQRQAWMADLQGMNQRQDLDKIPFNASPLLVNISLSKAGSWRKRSGTDMLSTTLAGGVQGIVGYLPKNGANTLHTIRNGNVDTYNSGTDAYTVIDSGVFPTPIRVEGVNYLDRVYFISTLANLCYESGGTCTDVLDTLSAGIQGGTIASAQNTLYIGQINGNENRVYYSLFDADTLQPTHVFWDTDKGETGFADSTRYFNLPGRNTALYSFGITGLVYAFTNNCCFEFDITKSQTPGATPRKVFDLGCANPRSITQCNGWMLWMDNQSKIWAWNGFGTPVPMSWDIEDDSNNESILSKVTGTMLNNVCAGADQNTFYFALGGDLVVDNRTITNACLVGLITQNLKYTLWSVYSLPVLPSIFTNIYFNNKQVLLVGTEESADVFLMNSGSNDDSPSGIVPISAYALTCFFNFGDTLKHYRPTTLFIKYRPQLTNDTYLYLKYAVNSNLSYTTLSDPDNSVNTHGVIEMYDVNAATQRDAISKVNFPTDAKCRTISIELGNNQLNESFEVSAIGFMYNLIFLDIPFKVT
jgi:hypothetical protein